MPDSQRGLTLRAVMLGLLVVIVICIWSTYVELYARSSRLTMGHFPLALFALLLALLYANPLMRRLRIAQLSAPELLVIVSMGLVTGLIYTLYLAYDHGAYNTYGFPPFFGGNPKAIFSNTLSMVRNPLSTDWNRLMFLGIGAAAMGVLTFMRGRLLWWRLHPIGFATSSMINTNFLAVPFFIAWAVKSTVLAVGGVGLYRKTIPLFIGLMVGYVAGVSLCSIVDIFIFPQQGHVVHTW